MKEVHTVSYACSVCGRQHHDEDQVKQCESNGLMLPYFKIGDQVTFQVNIGSDRDGPYYKKYTGTITKILFPKSINRAFFDHDYQVSYLVDVVKQEQRYFNEDPVQNLLVTEASMFFENEDYINAMGSPNTHRSRRNIVMSWSNYLAMVSSDNPQDMDGFRTTLEEFGCLE